MDLVRFVGLVKFEYNFNKFKCSLKWSYECGHGKFRWSTRLIYPQREFCRVHACFARFDLKFN